jgi:hypothetical protein
MPWLTGDIYCAIGFINISACIMFQAAFQVYMGKKNGHSGHNVLKAVLECGGSS